jgi:hypothetical protein
MSYRYRIEGRRQRDVLRARSAIENHSVIEEGETYAIIETSHEVRRRRHGPATIDQIFEPPIEEDLVSSEPQPDQP